MGEVNLKDASSFSIGLFIDFGSLKSMKIS